ncbi:MAG: hypothetical protein HQL43_09185 [Alphaproteobacteria bacterium]|nr:hypothetical protein [Alphaproteobacteria bacterium]
MPILQVPNFLLVQVFSAMMSAVCYPIDIKQQSFFATGIERLVITSVVELGFHKISPANQSTYSTLARHAGAFPIKLDRLTEKIDHGREIARDLLGTTMSLHRYLPDHASLEKAGLILEQRYRGRKIPKKRNAHKVAWRSYKSVAPILLSFQFHMDELEAACSYFDDSSEDASFEEQFAPEAQEPITDEERITAETEFDVIQSRLLEVNFLSMSKMEQETFCNNEFGEGAYVGFMAFLNLMSVMAKIVATARQISVDASQAYAHGQKKKREKPLLRLGEVWRIPPKYICEDTEVRYLPLSDEDVKIFYSQAQGNP